MVHVIDVSGSEGRNPIEDFEKINKELRNYSDFLAQKPQVVCANKIDMIDIEDAEYIEFVKYVESKGIKVFPVSAPINIGVKELLNEVAAMLKELIIHEFSRRFLIQRGDLDLGRVEITAIEDRKSVV